jgi:hypothetical protein
MEQLGSHWMDFHDIVYLSKDAGKFRPRTGRENPEGE